MQEVKLNEIRKQSNAMRESLRELRTNIRFCGDDIKTILFTSVMPNEGKSTVVMDFARSLVEADNRVLVIDADMRKSVLVGRHRAKTSDGGSILGLSHFLSGQKSLEEVVYQTQFANLMMIFAGPSVINPTELLEGKYYSDLIESMKGVFDYVLIDCAPALSELTYNALGAATGVIIPVQLGSLSVDGIGRMMEAYKAVKRKLNNDLDMRGLLIVMADERTNLARETSDFLRDTYDADMFKTRIRQCVKVGESQFQHQDIFDYAPDCTAARDYDDFITELLNNDNEE